MAQYQNLLREQPIQIFEGSPAPLNYSIYPSPDRCKQNSIDLNRQIKNNNSNYFGRSQSFIDEQNYLLKTAAAKELQESNMNIINPIGYGNQEMWDEIGNPSDQTYVQNVLCPYYLPQESVSIPQPQKTIMTYGNVTPISPNHNKILGNYVDGISGNKLMEGATFISDINSPSLKENIDAIQHQSELINNNILSLSPSSLTFPDIKAINSRKLNLMTNTNNEEIMAANTLLGPKTGISTAPLLTDVVLMPSTGYANSYSSISQESVLPTATSPTTVNPTKLTGAPFVQSYKKVNKDFYSPMLSPAFSQIYSTKPLNTQTKAFTTNPKVMEYERINKVRKNTVPLIKTTINKKTNKLSKSFSSVNLKTINPLTINTNIVNKKVEDGSLVQKMDIDVNVFKEKEAFTLDNNNVIPSGMDVEKQPSNILLNNTALVEEPLDAVLITPNSSSDVTTLSSISDSSSSNVNDTKTNEVEVKDKKKEEEKEEEEVKVKNKDQPKITEMEIVKSEIVLKKDEKEGEKEKAVVIKNKETKPNVEGKKKPEVFKTKKTEETKKKEKKDNTVSLPPEKDTKEKSEGKTDIKEKSSVSKETEESKKDSKKDTTTDNTPPKPKKRPRFSAKNAKNDPAAIEAHVLLKRKRNTEAARRSRQRKVQQMKNLEEAVQKLTKELEQATNELKEVNEKYEKVVEESKKSKETYETKIKALEEQLKKYNP
ncbi:hypothetical protein PIROE2DRAFT_3936 [Piromyces sp. E2]|nr:hypothetical protein PIROE2DRAFT_3936 [Piromyces sp. E2]|eukprot:OUM68341.1 hypothetical protein PIROE2DRAFT_3936 [Piromyces sp. E2]